jgi:hypothetical protein
VSGERPDDANGEPERASQISRGVSLVSRDMAEGEPVERGRSRAHPGSPVGARSRTLNRLRRRASTRAVGRWGPACVAGRSAGRLQKTPQNNIL